MARIVFWPVKALGYLWELVSEKWYEGRAKAMARQNYDPKRYIT